MPSIGVVGGGGGLGIMDVFWNYTLQFTHITVNCRLSQATKLITLVLNMFFLVKVVYM